MSAKKVSKKTNKTKKNTVKKTSVKKLVKSVKKSAKKPVKVVLPVVPTDVVAPSPPMSTPLDAIPQLRAVSVQKKLRELGINWVEQLVPRMMRDEERKNLEGFLGLELDSVMDQLSKEVLAGAITRRAARGALIPAGAGGATQTAGAQIPAVVVAPVMDPSGIVTVRPVESDVIN